MSGVRLTRIAPGIVQVPVFGSSVFLLLDRRVTVVDAGVPGSAGRVLPAGRPLAISENHGFAAFITDRYKLIVWEDTKEPVALFDLESDPNEDADLVDDPEAGPIRRQIMERHVEPFLSTAPVRLGLHMVERQSHAADGQRTR
ncbi:MAG: hypothetical protein ACRDJE_22545 [Dehalococcoidia bacterium]